MDSTSRANSEVGQTPTNKSRAFKDHPQPPVNERLDQARNFLADEDPNRYLGFRERLGEVEEYIKYILDEKLDHDASLLRDVKVMAQVHRDWDRRTQKGPEDSVCCDSPSIMPGSLRLVSSKNTQKFQEEKEAMGIETKMRDDHPPFTAWREDDQVDFLKAMREDAQMAPEDIEEKTNLLWVESRAYARALKEPGLIPYWMHDTKGLPMRGLKQGNTMPWYRAIDEKRRPPLQPLPDYLKRRQNEINRLLKAGRTRTEEDQKKLEELLQVHGSNHLKALYAKYEDTKTDRDYKAQKYGSVLFGTVTDKEMEKANEEFKVAERNFQRAFRTWCRRFKGGVQLMVLKPGRRRTDYPGVFYFPPKEIIPLAIYDEAQKVEDTLRKARIASGGFRDLDVEEKKLLIKCLGSVVDERAFLNYCNGLRQPEYHGHVPSQDPNHVNNLADIKFSVSMDAFALNHNTIKVLSPGEIDEGNAGVYCLEYHPPSGDISSIEETSSGNVEVQADTVVVEEVGAVVDDAVLQTREPATTTTTQSNSMDFSGKAERRGIQRAAIELALNLVATNQEQHRPEDRFRKLELPSKYKPPPKEVPISLPLEPSKRPVEMDSFKFTKELMEFRHLKDLSYELARTRLIGERPENLHPPANLNGPFTVASTEDKQDIIKERQSRLTDLCSRLVEAEKLAPRALIQRILLRVQQAISRGLNQAHPLWDKDELITAGIDQLFEIAAPSWDGDRKSYDDLNLALTPQQKAELREFEQDVDEIRDILPLWKPREPVTHPSEEQEYSEVELFQNPQHDHHQQSHKGMGFYPFKHKLNENRFNRRNNEVHLWDDGKITTYLGIMRQANRIHIDSDRGIYQISRIPLSGHPENKFVIARESAEQSPGVRRNELGNLEVQYDADGTMGPPIVQANKFYHLQKLAFRVGRDISRLLHQLAREHGDSDTYLMEQLVGLNVTLKGVGKISIEDRPNMGSDAEPATSDVGGISLQRLAVELHKIAPHLAQGAGIDLGRDPNAVTDGEAAALLQMEILEESSNNWESRFPEKEHVWEFAAPRVETIQRVIHGHTVNARKMTTQFFNMRRFPVRCQSAEIQTGMMTSGPRFERMPEPRLSPPPQKSRGGDRPVEIYRGAKQRPHFPFGETPYQQAYLDFTMRRDLQDGKYCLSRYVNVLTTLPVPEFQPRIQRRGLLDKILGPERARSITLAYALPKLPENWKFVGASLPEPSHLMIEISESLTGSENDMQGNVRHRGLYEMSGALNESDNPTGPASNVRPKSSQKKRPASAPGDEQGPSKKSKRVKKARTN
ncbi:uncharacterized protein BP5553_09969 [Venustampulla echinocandica]|uniref:Uncharacterized protein n=1 Tax=Venustampulla echinocandica TaxID=2656787 RepID=A0A370TB66_9HELO|nr:uncharacterized protein BP5553_09969 [Venustampulla echinocandica]RDL31180.1 hypothetical protein BP5553_09969 [Venustampulla echinocandica]